MATATSLKTLQSPEFRHLKPLDGVRGLAILMVMLSHAFEANAAAASLPLRIFASLFYFGKFGVDLFFVLSGFLITGILIDTRHDPSYFQRFFSRRALRILPLYYGVLFVLLALTLPLHLHWDGMAVPLLTYVQNYFPDRIKDLHVGPHLALFHFWSLAIEEQFYLVWPFLVYAMRGSKRRLLITAVSGSALALVLRLVMLAHHVDGLAIHVATYTRMDALLIGGILAIAYRSPRAWKLTLRFAPWIFLAFATPVVTMAVAMHGYDGEGHQLWMYGFRYTILAFGFAALLAWSLRKGSAVQWLFERSWLRFLGKYSYGLYVLHVLVFSVNLDLRDELKSLTGSRALSVVGAGLVCIGLSIVAAYLSFQLFEKHFLKLKHLFDYERADPIVVSR